MAHSLDWTKLIDADRPPDLGPGPRRGVLADTAVSESVTALLSSTRLSADRQACIRALVLLWHDHLDSAHTIAQAIDHADGAFVHGIMHRREPDYGNAAYWFRRVGSHPAFPGIAAAAAKLLEARGARELSGLLLPRGAWNPFAFIDACEQASQSPQAVDEVTILKEVQRIETEELLQYFRR